MTFWRKIPTRAYLYTMIASAVGLLAWNYFIIGEAKSRVPRQSVSRGLEFEMNDGRVATLPDSSGKYSCLVFWAAGSERSMKLLADAAGLQSSGKYDSLIQFYWVNVADSLETIRSAVAYDDFRQPFARHPRGEFMNRFQITSLPLTVILLPDGKILNTVEGYQPGDLVGMLDDLVELSKRIGPTGEVRFQFGGKQ